MGLELELGVVGLGRELGLELEVELELGLELEMERKLGQDPELNLKLERDYATNEHHKFCLPEVEPE